jgi:hypothetical protein
MSFGGGGGGDNKVKDTPEQRHLAKVAAEKWNFAQEELAPLENAYMESVGQMTDPGKTSFIRGRTMQSLGRVQPQLSGQASDQMTQAGIDPSSGRYQQEMSGIADDIGAGGGETLGRAQFEQQNEQVKGLQNIVAMGQSEATQAQQGISGLAQQASQDAIGDATNRFNRRSANLQLLGTVAGAGTRYGLNSGGSSTSMYDEAMTGGLQ